MRITSPKTGRLAGLLVGTALAAAALTSTARAEIVGTLQCNIAGGMGAIIGSQRAVSCTYASSAGPTELYTGSISRLGVDIGQITAGTLTYNVIEAGSPAPGALAGTYVGPGFGVTIGTGAGLNALVGGNGNAITLQPISGTTSSGLNINAGVGALNLVFAGLEKTPRLHRHRHSHHHHHHR